MASLWNKLRTLTLGNLHALLDKAIDLNSIAAVKQHIRDLEEAKDELGESVAVAKARVVTLGNQRNALKVQIDTTNENIDLVLTDADESNDHLAEPLEQRLMGYEEQMSTLAGELETAEKTHKALAEASVRLTGKHREMLSALRRLEALDRSTRAKEQAASALKQAGAAGSSADAVSVDNVTQRLEERAAVADAKFDSAMGTFQDDVGESIEAIKARQRIAERRQRLAAKAGDKS